MTRDGTLAGGVLTVSWPGPGAASVTITGHPTDSVSVGGATATFPRTLSADTIFDFAQDCTVVVSVAYLGIEILHQSVTLNNSSETTLAPGDLKYGTAAIAALDTKLGADAVNSGSALGAALAGLSNVQLGVSGLWTATQNFLSATFRNGPHRDVTHPDFGADNTGATSAAAAIQSAYDGLTKGKLYLPAGDYKLSTGLVFDATKPVKVHQARGAVLKPDANVRAVTWKAQSLPAYEGRHHNLQVDGGIATNTDGPTASNGTVGLRLENVTFAVIDRVKLIKCDTLIQLVSAKNDAGTPLWCEHNRISGEAIYGNVGLDVITTDGTGSFAGTDVSQMNFDRCKTHIRQDANSSLYRSRFAGVQMWLRQDQIGWDLSGNLDGMDIACSAEAITGTNQTLFKFASTAQNLYTIRARLKTTGFDEIASFRVVNNTTTDNFTYTVGSHDFVIDSAEKTTNSRWRLRRPGWTRGGLELTFGGSGGTIWFGPGGSTAPDTKLERQASDKLGMATGDSFGVDGTWNGGQFLLGANHLWVDATGVVRTKSSAPTSDLDGSVVGPITPPAGTPAAATDLATALTLVNDLRSKLLALNIVA